MSRIGSAAMMRWLSLTGRRTAAFALDVGSLAALSALVIWWDDRAGILYGYNAEQLGNIVVVAWFVFPEVLWRATLGKTLAGLRICASDGLEACRFQTAFRSLLFWLSVLAPQTFVPRSNLFAALLDNRQQWIGAISFGLTVVLLPLVSCTFSRESIGVHDFLTNTRVLRASETSRGGPTLLPAFNWKWSPRLYAVGCLLFAFLAGMSMAIDWSLNVGPALASTIRVNKRYYETAIAEADRSSASYGMMTASLTESYVTASPHLILPGSTQQYVVLVRRSLLADYPRAISYSREFAIQQLKFGLPSGVERIVIDLTNSRQFGPFILSRTLPVLIDLKLGVTAFPPREVADTQAAGESELAAKLPAWVDGKLIDVNVIWNRPHVDRVFGITLTTWDPISFDVLTVPDLRAPRPLGSAR